MFTTTLRREVVVGSDGTELRFHRAASTRNRIAYNKGVAKMYLLLVFSCFSFFIPAVVFAAAKGDPCVTPNGENATCQSIHNCTAIKQAIAYLDKDAIEFARKSQCGFEDAPLVCCGSTGELTTTSPKPTIPISDGTSRPLPSTPQAATELPKPIDNIHLPDHSLCGIQVKQNRIFGGQSAEIDEFPWMVNLKYVKDDGSDGGFRCGGTLINYNHVLTAAQCLNIRGYKLASVRLGEWKFSTEKDCVADTANEVVCADPVLDVAIEKTISHPYYSKRSGNNDIALLRLEKKVKFSDYVRPICLPPIDYPPPPPGTRMHISGWGLTENGTQADVKIKAVVPMVSNEVCANLYPNSTTVNTNQACAGGEQGVDACNGDAGGPLMRTYLKQDESEDEQWLQEGIIHRGLGCGRKGVPGLYTRVSRYVNWILNQIKE